MKMKERCGDVPAVLQPARSLVGSWKSAASKKKMEPIEEGYSLHMHGMFTGPTALYKVRRNLGSLVDVVEDPIPTPCLMLLSTCRRACPDFRSSGCHSTVNGPAGQDRPREGERHPLQAPASEGEPGLI